MTAVVRDATPSVVVRSVTKDRLRVAVVGGGANSEHDVSLASAASAVAALRERHDVLALTIDRDGTWCDEAVRPRGLASAVLDLQASDVVLPLVHGVHGEDGTLAALCELAGTPYVGSPVAAGALGMDKWATKLVAQAVGLAVADGDLVARGEAAAYAQEGRMEHCVVKPVTAGSSLGVTLVDGRDQLAPALAAALVLDDRVLVEEVLTGREIDIAVLCRADGTRQLSPPLEVVADGLFDFDSKYAGGARFVVPAPLAADQLAGLERAALRMVSALGCAGVVRVDFFLTAAGWVLNEVNTAPCFTSASQVPQMYAHAGLPYVGLLDTLVRDAVVRWTGRVRDPL